MVRKTTLITAVRTGDCLIRRKRRIGEKPFVLVFIKVGDMILILLLTNTALTAVATYELTPASEFVDGKTAVVGTSVTVGHGGGVFQLIDLVNGKHGGRALTGKPPMGLPKQAPQAPLRLTEQQKASTE